LLVDHPDLMMGGCQGSQVNPGNRWNKILLVPKAIALNVSQNQVNFHRDLPFLCVIYLRIITPGWQKPPKGLRIVQIQASKAGAAEMKL
jgi:hypothetical protein